jgi:hypothetical protein
LIANNDTDAFATDAAMKGNTNMARGIRTLGMDISLNHGAMVLLDGGKKCQFWYYTDLAGSADRCKNGYRIDPDIFKAPKGATRDKHILGIRRLAWIRDFINIVLKISSPDYAALEDYAVRAEQGAHYLGEVGAVARTALWDFGIKFRLHDPISVKMFVTHDGTAQKDAVQRAVESRWGEAFYKYDQPPPKPTQKRPNPKHNRTTSEDLADAYALSQLARTEYLLRSGALAMSKLHEKEVRVFNRITKTYPVSLLDREWIYKGDYDE